MADDQDWRLRVDIDDPSALHARLRGARHFERELDPLIADDVVLSFDDDTVFAYANTSASIEEVRRAVERQLAQDGLTADIHVAHWDDGSEVWLAPGEAPPRADPAIHAGEDGAAPEPSADDPIVTRTYAETSGRIVRNYFENIVAGEAQSRGVKLSIVEHPHLLTTQLAFNLTGPSSAVDGVIAAIQSDANNVTRFESANLTPI
jgi:hypothetical protein